MVPGEYKLVVDAGSGIASSGWITRPKDKSINHFHGQINQNNVTLIDGKITSLFQIIDAIN